MKKRLPAGLLVLCMLFSLAACGSKSNANAIVNAIATSMRLMRTQGQVHISDDAGAEVTPRERLGLYSGYGVDTGEESFAWINLDDVKLTKMDEDSEIEITKDGRALELNLVSGSLFFHVTEPLTEDETMNIRTSSMVVGIRGTCGWVTADTACLLEGTVSVTAGVQSVTVTAGEMAVMTADGALEVKPLSAGDIPDFVLVEAEDDEELMTAVSGGGTPNGPDSSTAGPEPSISPSTGLETTAPVGYTDSGSCGSNTWWGYDEGAHTLTIGGYGNMANYYFALLPWDAYAADITTIVVESGVTSIGEQAFCNCKALTSIILPDSVTSIGAGAFFTCTSLTSVIIPDGVTMIQKETFDFCENLTDITLPRSITAIGNYAFSNCRSLTDVYYAGTEEEFQAINIGNWNESQNGSFAEANIHYNYRG